MNYKWLALKSLEDWKFKCLLLPHFFIIPLRARTCCEVTDLSGSRSASDSAFQSALKPIIQMSSVSVSLLPLAGQSMGPRSWDSRWGLCFSSGETWVGSHFRHSPFSDSKPKMAVLGRGVYNSDHPNLPSKWRTRSGQLLAWSETRGMRVNLKGN